MSGGGTGWRRLTEAAICYADVSAEDDAAFLRARDRLRKAAVAYVRQLDDPLSAWLAATREADASVAAN